MFYIGIDFSINSPGVCIVSDGICHWVSNTTGPKTKADVEFIKKIKNCQDITYILFETGEQSQESIDSYSENEYRKIVLYINRAKSIKQIILDKLIELGYEKGNSVHFGFEGFSYGSNTNNIIDIAIATGFLKLELINEFGDNMTLDVMAPGTIKKYAGSGRYNKKEMYDVFVENRHGDVKLGSSDFWSLSQSLRGLKKIPKPTDDLIDAYFVVNALKGKIEK
jgi:hypothetical protein